MGTKIATAKNHEMTSEFPSLRKLCDQRGFVEVSRMFGLSDSAVNQMITAGRCRPVYELAASLILEKEEKTEAMLVMKLTAQQKTAVLPILAAMNIAYMDLDL